MLVAPSLRAAIVDDEAIVRAGIRTLLRQTPDITVVGEAESGEQAVSLVRRERPELLFLDVRLPGIDGFDVLAELRTDLPPAIIIVTAYANYGPRAFDHYAVDYLLKPFDAPRFHTALARARRRLTSVRERGSRLLGDQSDQNGATRSGIERILVRQNGRAVVVSVADIDCVAAADNYVCIHSGPARYLIRTPLATLERQLDSADFVRIHRSTIVRLSRVREIRSRFGGRYEVVLLTGARFPLSRGYRDAVRRLLGGDPR